MRRYTRAVIASGAKQSRTGEPQTTGLPPRHIGAGCLSLRSLLAMTNGGVLQLAETIQANFEELVV